MARSEGMATVSSMTSVAAGAADISVVIPTYNRVDLLQQTLASIEAQTYPPAEIVVVDDGSTDGTRQMLKERSVTVVANENGGWGPARARNAGLEQVSTDYVAFVDSDDILFPQAFESLRAAAAAAPDAPFAYGCALAISAVNGGWGQQGVIATTRAELRAPLVSLFVRNSVPASGAIARTDVVREIGGYDPLVVWSEDHHLWIRLAQQAPPAYFPGLVGAYRRHPGNRYNPVQGGADAAPIFALAERDHRLREHVPERAGVILCETVLAALRGSGISNAVRVARRVLDHHDAKHRIVARAVKHARLRRASARLGDAVWRERPDVRDWLAGF
jgi:glycosyltransferase involved in cell wall biosynthesis